MKTNETIQQKGSSSKIRFIDKVPLLLIMIVNAAMYFLLWFAYHWAPTEPNTPFLEEFPITLLNIGVAISFFFFIFLIFQKEGVKAIYSVPINSFLFFLFEGNRNQILHMGDYWSLLQDLWFFWGISILLGVSVFLLNKKYLIHIEARGDL